MIEILKPVELTRLQETGALDAHVLQSLESRSVVGTNLLDIDRWTRTTIVEAGARSCYVDHAPSFDRGPFGHHICTAVNDADGGTLRATGCRTAHSEHTVAITRDGADIRTLPPRS